MLPFKETLVESNVMYDEVIREFSKDTNNEDLNWHRDKENRHVQVISGKEWYMQFENKLPFLMQEGFSFVINKLNNSASLVLIATAGILGTFG